MINCVEPLQIQLAGIYKIITFQHYSNSMFDINYSSRRLESRHKNRIDQAVLEV